MSEKQNVITIAIDDEAREILTKVDPMYRESLVNIGIKMIAKTSFFNTVSGQSDKVNINNMTSLSNMDNPTTVNETVEESKPKPKKKAVANWDNL